MTAVKRVHVKQRKTVPLPRKVAARKARVEARVVTMRDERGMTFAEIGERLGVSRQRAHAIYWTAREA